MIVVADTTPLHYLILIEQDRVLPALYGRVIVPPAVIAEPSHAEAPPLIRTWLTHAPQWLEVRGPRNTGVFQRRLGAGEQEAIAVAEELAADALLIDDLDGRHEALRRRIHVFGTLGVLADASDEGLLDPLVAVGRLRQTNFRATDQLFEWLLSRAKPPADR